MIVMIIVTLRSNEVICLIDTEKHGYYDNCDLLPK